jgi:6-phosphogluconolactonase
MRIPRTVAVMGGVIALGVAGPIVSAAGASTPHSPVVGHAYVNDNTTTENTVSAFDRHADGTLTPESGSPFAVGGVGLGAGTASQGAIEATPDGAYLVAVDAGSNEVSVLKVKGNGGLRLIGQPVSSNGIKPVSVAITRWGRHTDLVYVANSGDGGANYTGFTLRYGHLRPLADSTVSLPDGSAPGDVLFNATGTHVAGTRVGTGLVDSFNVRRDGLLDAATGSPFPSQGPGPIGAEFRPTNPSQLFVSNAHGGPNNGTVSAFQVAPSGALTSIGTGPFADLQTAPCWVEISKDGHYLYTTNTAVPSISSYYIHHDGSLTLLHTAALSATTEKGPVDLRLSPNGKWLYAVDGGSQAISSFRVNGGSLTPLSSSPTALPAGTSPVGIVVS